MNEVGESVAVLRGRDFEVWALQQRPVCAYRHITRRRTLLCSYGRPMAPGAPEGSLPFRTSRRMGISQKIGIGRNRPLVFIFLLFRTLFRRRWVVFAIRLLETSLR